MQFTKHLKKTCENLVTTYLCVIYEKLRKAYLVNLEDTILIFYASICHRRHYILGLSVCECVCVSVCPGMYPVRVIPYKSLCVIRSAHCVITQRRALCFAAVSFLSFFLFSARSPRSLGQSLQNFAT